MCLFMSVCLNPLGPKSDQQQLSPYIINTSSREKATRVIQLITEGKMHGFYVKFSRLIFEGNVLRSVWRICMLIFWLEVLKVCSIDHIPELEYMEWALEIICFVIRCIVIIKNLLKITYYGGLSI